MKESAFHSRVMALASCVLLVLVFVAVVVFLRGFKPEADGFEQKGMTLVLYHASRVGLALYMLLFCYTAGYRALEIFRVDPQRLVDGARRTFILCFFLGASLYGIGFALLGLAGLLGPASGLALTIPVLLLSYRPLQALLPEGTRVAVILPASDTQVGSLFTRLVFLMAVVSVLLFVLTRVVFIPNADGNVWEHYLHYYRAVQESGSTQPNEVWHHFYNSKGGGLVFLANELSDFFGVQLVSACFVVVAALIILDLLLECCESASWALFGVTLFFAHLAGDVSSGALFRVHGVLLGYASFALWASVLLHGAAGRELKVLTGASAFTLGYLGYYLPVATALFPLAFLLLALTNRLLREETRFYPLFILASAVAAGTALGMVTNWILTGLLELTPVRLLWAIADRAKFEQVFGLGGIEFFLAMNNELLVSESRWQIINFMMRYPLPRGWMYLTLLAAIVLSIRLLTRSFAEEGIAKPEKLFVRLFAFIIALDLFVALVPSPSVYRMGLYTIVFTTLGSVVIWKRFVDHYLAGPRVPPPGIGNDAAGASIQPKSKRWQAATVVIVTCGIVTAFTYAMRGMNVERQVIKAYAKGTLSLKEAFERMESRQKPPAPVPSVAQFSEFQRSAHGAGRILTLTYVWTGGVYSYLLPGAGIVSEPTYALVRNPSQLRVARAGEVAAYLRDRDIRFFSLDLGNRLFSTIAFTSLFDPREISKYFSVAYEDGDYFILTWRLDDREKPLPDHLLTLLDLKRSGVLHYPFTGRFARRLMGGDRWVDTIEGFDKARKEVREEIDSATGAEMLSRLSREASTTLVRRILSAGKEAIDKADPRAVLELQPSVWVQPRFRVSERELKRRLVQLFTDAVYREYVAVFGTSLSALSRRCDERFPYGVSRPTEATCN